MRPRLLNRAGDKRGITLVEILAYVGIFMVAANLCAQTFVMNMRLSAYGTAGLERVSGASELGEVFRRAVREAEGVAAGVGAYVTNEGQLVLRLPDDASGKERFAVLRAPAESKRFQRLILRRDGETLEAEAFQIYGPEITDISFAHDGRRVAMNITLARPQDSARGEARHFIAAMRSRGSGS